LAPVVGAAIICLVLSAVLETIAGAKVLGESGIILVSFSGLSIPLQAINVALEIIITDKTVFFMFVF
jgi:hypothetical protein